MICCCWCFFHVKDNEEERMDEKRFRFRCKFFLSAPKCAQYTRWRKRREKTHTWESERVSQWMNDIEKENGKCIKAFKKIQRNAKAKFMYSKHDFIFVGWLSLTLFWSNRKFSVLVFFPVVFFVGILDVAAAAATAVMDVCFMHACMEHIWNH